MTRKKNLKDYINPNEVVEGVEYENLTENEKNMIGNIKFYRKMIKNKNRKKCLLPGKMVLN